MLDVLGQLKTDRQFTFYDVDRDGRVTFEEYARMSSKCQMLLMLRIHYLTQKTGSPPIVFEEC